MTPSRGIHTVRRTHRTTYSPEKKQTIAKKVLQAKAAGEDITAAIHRIAKEEGVDTCTVRWYGVYKQPAEEGKYFDADAYAKQHLI